MKQDVYTKSSQRYATEKPPARPKDTRPIRNTNMVSKNDLYPSDLARTALEGMRSYHAAHPSSPAAVRCPALSIRRGLWIALLGPNAEEGIVGVGSTVEAALRAFDTQYLAGRRPPSE